MSSIVVRILFTTETHRNGPKFDERSMNLLARSGFRCRTSLENERIFWLIRWICCWMRRSRQLDENEGSAVDRRVTFSEKTLVEHVLLADQIAIDFTVLIVSRDEWSVDFTSDLVKPKPNRRRSFRYVAGCSTDLRSNCRMVTSASRSRSMEFGNRLRPTVWWFNAILFLRQKNYWQCSNRFDADRHFSFEPVESFGYVDMTTTVADRSIEVGDWLLARLSPSLSFWSRNIRCATYSQMSKYSPRRFRFVLWSENESIFPFNWKSDVEKKVDLKTDLSARMRTGVLKIQRIEKQLINRWL